MSESRNTLQNQMDPLFDLILALYKEQSIALSCPVCASKEIVSNHLYHPQCQNCGLEFNIGYSQPGKLATAQLLLQDPKIREKGESAYRFFSKARMNFQKLSENRADDQAARTGSLIAEIACFDCAGIKKILKEEKEQLHQSLKSAEEKVKQESSLLHLLILISLLKRSAWLSLIQGKNDQAKELDQSALNLLEALLKQSDSKHLKILQKEAEKIRQRIVQMQEQNTSAKKPAGDKERMLLARLKQAARKIEQGKEEGFQTVHRPDFVKAREIALKLLETDPLSSDQQVCKLILINSFYEEGRMILEKGNSSAALKRFQEGQEVLKAFEWALDPNKRLALKEKFRQGQEKALAMPL